MQQLMRRQATPLLVSQGPNCTAEPLSRVEFQKLETGQYDERWVQSLVHHCPSVLPIASIEPAFWPAASVCMELGLRSGYLDNLLVTPLGNLIVVECKLWRNPEAQRKVVAQIIDYAKDLQALSYADLQHAIRAALKNPEYSLFSHVSAAANEPEPPLDETRFVDAVNSNLRRGRLLLLIVGDGITENIESMSEFLQQHAGLHFALALVQLAVHELPGTKQRLVVPSIPMRTTNIIRGIVQIADGLPTIVAPPEKPSIERASTLTEDEVFAELDRLRSGTSDRLIAFLKDCEDLQVTWEVKRTIIVRMIIGEYKVIPFVILSNGMVDTSYTSWSEHKALFRGFTEALAAAIPEAIHRETPKSWVVKGRDGRFITVWDLLDNQSACRTALEELNTALRRIAVTE